MSMAGGVEALRASLMSAAAASREPFLRDCRRAMERGGKKELAGLRRRLRHMAGLMQLLSARELLREAHALDRALASAAENAAASDDPALSRACLLFMERWCRHLMGDPAPFDGPVQGSVKELLRGASGKQATPVPYPEYLRPLLRDLLRQHLDALLHRCAALPVCEADSPVKRWPGIRDEAQALASALTVSEGRSPLPRHTALDRLPLGLLCRQLLEQSPGHNKEPGHLQGLMRSWLSDLRTSLEAPRGEALPEAPLYRLVRMRRDLLRLQPFLPGEAWLFTVDALPPLIWQCLHGDGQDRTELQLRLLRCVLVLEQQLQTGSREWPPVSDSPRQPLAEPVDRIWADESLHQEAAAENRQYLHTLEHCLDEAAGSERAPPVPARLCVTVYKLWLNLRAMGLTRLQELAGSLHKTLMLGLQQHRRLTRERRLLLQAFRRTLGQASLTEFPRAHQGGPVSSLLRRCALESEADLVLWHRAEIAPSPGEAATTGGMRLPEHLASDLRYLPAATTRLRGLAGAGDDGSARDAFVQQMTRDLALLINGAHRLRVYRIEALAMVLQEVYRQLALTGTEWTRNGELCALLRRAHRSLQRMLDQAAAWQEVASARATIAALYAWLEHLPRPAAAGDISELLLESRSANRRIRHLLKSDPHSLPSPVLLMELLQGQDEILCGIAERLPAAHHSKPPRRG